mmetsp:Transcript_16987/g.43417  ORF Transcript_16987/g.43417 Transcript_16987/m.43417 type:complete len:247 (-) Transcript_16987:363-1103(-)
MLSTASSLSLSFSSSNSSPVYAFPAPAALIGLGATALASPAPTSSNRPICEQTHSAVFLLSPVTTMTRMPAMRHVSSAGFTSSRGGSTMPTNPTNVIPVSSLVASVRFPFGSGLSAKPMHRSAWRPPYSANLARICALAASVSGTDAPLSLQSTCEQRSSTFSGAPLVNIISWPLRVHRTLMIFLSRVKSTVAMRWNCELQYVEQYVARSCFDRRCNALGIESNPGSPTFSPYTSSATSVLSPILL